MPRFFFHFGDGKRTFTDSIGVELMGIAAAREHARAQIHEMKTGMSELTFQNWSGWKMIVIDAKGQEVFEVGFGLKPQ